VKTAVERRQASAPASGGRRKPHSPWRVPHAACVRAKDNASAGVPLSLFLFS
jgi:hypothetical protein